MSRLSHLAVAAVGLAVVLTACDTSSSSATRPVIHFVGNDSCPTSGSQAYDPAPPDTSGNPVGEAIDEMPHTHVQPGTKITYLHDPPTSGCHYNVQQTATQQGAPIIPGFYNQAIAAEYWVHNLEHGYVVVLYNCPAPPGCDSEAKQLADWQKGLAPEPPYPYAKVIVVPYVFKDPSVKFAVVSWDYYLGMGSLDMGKIQAFYDNHHGHGPEAGNPP